MSSEKSTFWSRFGLWFRSPSRSDGFDPSQDVLVGSPSEDSIDNPVIPAADSGGRFGSRFRLGNREAAIERLEEGYNKVIQLVESMQRHMAIQEERSESIAQSLTNLVETLAHMPESSAKAHELLERLGERAESQTTYLRRLEEVLSQLPDLADAQRETMTSVSHQLVGVRQSTEQVTGTLDGFRAAVNGLGEATRESTATLSRLHTEASTRDAKLSDALQEQTRRFTIFSVIAVCVAVVASIISLVALLR